MVLKVVLSRAFDPLRIQGIIKIALAPDSDSSPIKVHSAV